jgi:hypothetical protein
MLPCIFGCPIYNGRMFDSRKNLTDAQNSNLVQYGFLAGKKPLKLSYSKTNKLISALYMVTDILDTAEPIRAKLRTLGLDLISDIESINLASNVLNSQVINRIREIVSLLEIAGSVNLISEMNINILRQEFFILKNAVEELVKSTFVAPERNLSDFLKDEPNSLPENRVKEIPKKSIGHITSTRLGVQKGSTLLKALSDKTDAMSDMKEKFNEVKRQRRDEIISIIKTYSQTYPTLGGATITDIRMKAAGALVNCGEKTLQRELVAMTESGILLRTGEKRWSRYDLPK